MVYDGLSLKQKKFADEYIISGNATESYKKVYTKVKKESVASAGASRMLKNVNVKQYIDKQLKKIGKEKIATAEEILTYWTNVMRGQSESEVIVIVGKGEGISEPKRLMKKPTEIERIQASKELAKRIIDTQTEESKEKKLERLLDMVEGVITDE